MINFKQLKIKNFLSYGNVPQDINLDNFSKTLISGINGGGKCFCINTMVKVRNTNTGEIYETTIGELFNLQLKTNP